MKAKGSGGALGGGGACTMTGAGGGGGGATYQDCTVNNAAATVSLTRRSAVLVSAFKLRALRSVPWLSWRLGAGAVARAGSTVGEASGISTMYPSTAAATPMRTLARRPNFIQAPLR